MQERAFYMLSRSKWTDCTFYFETEDAGVAGGTKKFIHAHKLILAMASPVFEAMFYGEIGDQNAVNITDIDQSTFGALLNYIYKEHTLVKDVEAAMSLYKAANKYMLVHIERKCLDHLSKYLSPENVCQIYEFACFFEKKTLQEQCLELIKTKTQQVLKSSGFRNAESDTLKTIVSMDTLDINSEMDLFNALVDYVENVKTVENGQNMEISLPIDQGQGDVHSSNESADNSNESAENRNKGAENSNKSAENSNKDSENNKDTLKTFEKLKETRLILRGIIENIRFLSMGPNDLAKINEKSALLSKDEICALLSNMFSPNSCVPMPDGFSRIREPRIRSAATFQYTVHNVTDMIRYYSPSPPCYVRNLPWKIQAQRESDYLGLYLKIDFDAESLSDLSGDVSCNATVELCLLTAHADVKPIVRKYDKTFSEGKAWGIQNFIAWNELIDPQNNFIQDDSITIEVHFTTEPVQGADIKPLQKCICNKGDN
ncbi:BTB/POZ domain-containing protein [Phthorimaea operculella]|nr:BTB/POZ domain-containing protein [Phthorimaea operculella]